MSRELNRDLFGEPLPQTPSRPSARQHEPLPSTSAAHDEIKMLNYQVEAMTKKIKDFESKMEMLASRWDEFSSTAKLRFERIQGSFQRQSESMQSTFRDVHSKIATVASRTNERKMSEVSIQEMVERHNQTVQSMEARLQQLHKVIAEQEFQLLSTKSEMKDVLKELMRLRGASPTER